MHLSLSFNFKLYRLSMSYSSCGANLRGENFHSLDLPKGWKQVWNKAILLARFWLLNVQNGIKALPIYLSPMKWPNWIVAILQLQYYCYSFFFIQIQKFSCQDFCKSLFKNALMLKFFLLNCSIYHISYLTVTWIFSEGANFISLVDKKFSRSLNESGKAK